MMAFVAVATPGQLLAQTPQATPEKPDIRPGQFIRRAESAATASSAVDFETEEELSATYIGAPAQQVISEILGDFLKVDYTVSPDVSGSVTLRLDGVRSRLSALDALRSALQPLGIAVIDRGDVVAVARSTGQAAPSKAAAISPGDPSPPGGGVVVITPRFILPSQLGPLLTPFAQAGAVVATDDGRRLLIVRGDEATISAASSAAAMFDVDWFSQVSSGLFPLQHIAPKDLVTEVRPLLGPSGAMIDLIPIPRLGAVMALSRSPDAMARLQGLIGQLDRSSSDISAGMLLYRAKHVSAEELASALVGAAPSTSSEPVQNATETATGGDSGSIGQFGAALNSNRTRAEPSFAPAAGPGGLSVSASPSQNMVVVRGNADALADARRLLEALDQLPAQVLIEAAIAEITLNDELEFGVNWSGIQDRLEATFTDAPSGAVTTRFPGLALTYVNTDIQAAISLLSSLTKVEVISRPSLVALNNETAELQVGDQVPIVTQSAISVANPDAPIVNQTTYRDTGVILVVTPHVRAGGMVELEVAQEVSQVARTTSSGIDSPTIQQRRLTSRLLVPSGKSVALGGLISTSTTNGQVGIPLLKDIPFFGQLFRSTSTFVEKTELVVFLTPRVLADPADAVDATDQLRSAFKKLEQQIARP